MYRTQKMHHPGKKHQAHSVVLKAARSEQCRRSSSTGWAWALYLYEHRNPTQSNHDNVGSCSATMRQAVMSCKAVTTKLTSWPARQCVFDVLQSRSRSGTPWISLEYGRRREKATRCSRIEKQLRRRVWWADLQYQKIFRLAVNSKPVWLHFTGWHKG